MKIRNKSPGKKTFKENNKSDNSSSTISNKVHLPLINNHLATNKSRLIQFKIICNKLGFQIKHSKNTNSLINLDS